MHILPIFTERLKLRQFTCNDLKEFQAYRLDPELSKYQGWEPISDDEALAFLQDQSAQTLGPVGQWLQVAVHCIDANQLIGDFGLCVLDSKLGIAAMGFTISHPFQQKGYATEAARAILSVLFATHEIQKIVSETDARNEPAIKLLQRLGFLLKKTDITEFRGEPCMEHTFALSVTQSSTIPYLRPGYYSQAR